MACDRFTFSSTGSSSPRRSVRRNMAPAIRLPVMNPVVRERQSRQGARGQDLASMQLAAANARIVELEAALHEARQSATHDVLTGVLNRRGLQEVFLREASRAKRLGQSLTLALIDLDDFKRINDMHGHAVGDAALVHLTRMMAATLRPTDICCRLGGEEFVLIMPDSDLVAARGALSRLQSGLEQVPVAATGITLSFSAGLATVASGEVLEQTLERADHGVYRAKAAGKRRVMAA